MKSFFALLAMMPVVAFSADNCTTMRTVPEGVQSLQDVIELGLCRNPQTAAAYQALQSTRFNKNAGYAKYLPEVSAGLSANKNFAQSKDNLRKDYDWSYGASMLHHTDEYPQHFLLSLMPNLVLC